MLLLSRRPRDKALRTALCEAAWAASHGQSTYLSAQYRRFIRRWTKNEDKAIFAVAHTRYLVHQLEALGHKITLVPAA